MSIRKMKLKDYGITPGRAAELKEMVKDKQYYSLVIEACNRANDFLASHLVKSFTERNSWRKQRKKRKNGKKVGICVVSRFEHCPGSQILLAWC